MGRIIAALAAGRLPYTTGQVDIGRWRDAGLAVLKGMGMKIALPDETGRMTDYRLVGVPVAAGRLGR